MHELRRPPWWGAIRALAILAGLAILLDSLALVGPPWVLIPPMLPIYFLGQLVYRAGGGR